MLADVHAKPREQLVRPSGLIECHARMVMFCSVGPQGFSPVYPFLFLFFARELLQGIPADLKRPSRSIALLVVVLNLCGRHGGAGLPATGLVVPNRTSEPARVGMPQWIGTVAQWDTVAVEHPFSLHAMWVGTVPHAVCSLSSFFAFRP